MFDWFYRWRLKVWQKRRQLVAMDAAVYKKHPYDPEDRLGNWTSDYAKALLCKLTRANFKCRLLECRLGLTDWRTLC